MQFTRTLRWLPAVLTAIGATTTFSSAVLAQPAAEEKPPEIKLNDNEDRARNALLLAKAGNANISRDSRVAALEVLGRNFAKQAAEAKKADKPLPATADDAKAGIAAAATLVDELLSVGASVSGQPQDVLTDLRKLAVALGDLSPADPDAAVAALARILNGDGPCTPYNRSQPCRIPCPLWAVSVYARPHPNLTNYVLGQAARAAAADALARIGTYNAAAALAVALDREEFAGISPAGAELLARLNASVRANAAKALGEAGWVDFVPDLAVAAETDGDAAVRTAAAAAIEAIRKNPKGPRENIPVQPKPVSNPKV
jgi:hypothetical protein